VQPQQLQVQQEQLVLLVLLDLLVQIQQLQVPRDQLALQGQLAQ
jgi:hypothetical protein